MRKGAFGASAGAHPCFSCLGPDKSTDDLRANFIEGELNMLPLEQPSERHKSNSQGGWYDTSFRLHHHVAAILLLDWEC